MPVVWNPAPAALLLGRLYRESADIRQLAVVQRRELCYAAKCSISCVGVSCHRSSCVNVTDAHVCANAAAAAAAWVNRALSGQHAAHQGCQGPA
jgi:hypothetical protein